jgi:hypothetical protein
MNRDFQKAASVGVRNRRAKMEKKKIVLFQEIPDPHIPCPTRDGASNDQLPETARF